MGRDLQTKNLTTCLHVPTVSPDRLQELKGNVSIVIFAVEMLDNTLTRIQNEHHPWKWTVCVFKCGALRITVLCSSGQRHQTNQERNVL